MTLGLNAQLWIEILNVIISCGRVILKGKQKLGVTFNSDKLGGTLLQILLGRGIHIDFSSQLKFAKIEFYGAFHL